MDLKEPVGPLALGQEGHAETAHEFGRGRYEYLLVQHHGKGQGHRFVLGHTALQEDLAAYGAVAHHAVEVVGNDGHYDAGGYVLLGCALLDGLADVRVDEGRAVLAELQGCIPLQGNGADVLGAMDGQVAGGDSSRKLPVPAEQASFMA
jgi:hypothetical protein